MALTLLLKRWLAPGNLVAVGLVAVPGVFVYVVLFWFISMESSEKRLVNENMLPLVRKIRYRLANRKHRASVPRGESLSPLAAPPIRPAYETDRESRTRCHETVPNQGIRRDHETRGLS